MNFTGEPALRAAKSSLMNPPLFRRRDMGANCGADVPLSAIASARAVATLSQKPLALQPKASIYRVPIAVLLRHVAPRWAGTQPPQNALDDVAIVLGRSSSPMLAGLSLNRQQHLQNTPLDLRQIAAAQDCLPESAAVNQNEILASIDFVHAPRRALGALKDTP